MRLCVLVPLLAGCLLAQDVQFTREGPYWKRTENAGMPPLPTRILKVSVRGHIVLRGGSGEQITYRLTEQVRARSEEEAHRLFGSGIITISSVNGVATLVVASFVHPTVITQLEVSVPRRIAGVILDVKAGDVEAYDLDGNLHIDTTAGLIHCDRIGGGVEANTGGGEIRFGKIHGPVRCTSLAGSISVDSAGAEANCQTAGGEIQIRDAGGPLMLSTEGGNIQVDKAASTVEAHTGEGVIEVFQAGGAVFADTRGGSIQIGSARGVRCQSGAGTIRVKTSSGPLRVQTAMGSILAELLAGAHIEDASLVAGSGDITVLIPSNLALSVLARNDASANPRGIVSDFSEVRVKRLGPSPPSLVYEGSINGGGPLLTINTGGGIIYVKKLK
jgi:DUF4097 and DUF4098 domain-containing protein YvlB